MNGQSATPRAGAGSTAPGSGTWAVQLSREAAGKLASLRGAAALRVCDAGQDIWLRADHASQELELQLRALPGARRFQVLDDGQLVPAGARVPQDRLPQGNWVELAAWLQVRLGVAALPGHAPPRRLLRLVRGGVPAECNILLTTAETWSAYAVVAPRLRLDRWTFALDEQDRVVVRGAPVPPIAGDQYVERCGVAIPAGRQWQPRVDAEVLAALCELAAGDLSLVQPDGWWDYVPADAFVRATRAAARAITPGET